MRQALRLFLVVAVSALLPSTSRSSGADYSGDFLAIGVGARALAMGSAYTAAAYDVTSSYWNPAGLTLVKGKEVATQHRTEGSLLLSGVGYDWFGVAVNLGKRGAYGISYMTFGVSGVPLYDYGSNPVLVDSNGAPIQTGNGDGRDNALMFSGALRFRKDLAVGITLKYLWSKILYAKASGIGADLGVLYKPWKKLTFGMNLQDFTGGTPYHWKGTPTNPTDTIPINLKLGMAYTHSMGPNLLTTALDIDTKFNPILHYGVEYWYHRIFAARLGLVDRGPSFSLRDKDPTVGAGFWLKVFELDYAFIGSEIVGIHNLSLITHF